MFASHAPIIGIDIGGVITLPPKGIDREDPFVGKDYLLVPKVDDSFSVIAELVEKFHVVIISKAGAVVQRKTNEWFEDQNFFQKTGLPHTRVFYTATRDEKTRVAIEHGVTHFIDDKLEVLGYMMGCIPNLFAFNTERRQRERYPYVATMVAHVNSWQELRGILIPT